MRKILITAAAGAALAITPALASKPASKPEHPQKPPHPAKCKILTVGYNAKGTLLSQTLIQSKGADTPTDKSDDEFTWPRLCAMAEVGWTDAAKRNYDEFMARMKDSQYPRLAVTHMGASQESSTEQLTTELAQRGAIEEKKKK